MPPAGFDEEELSTDEPDDEELPPDEFDEEESLSVLQALRHSSYTAAQRLESAVIFIQTGTLSLQELMHLFELFPCASDATEMPEKEKNNKDEIMTKNDIMENILNCFITIPPSIYRHVS